MCVDETGCAEVLNSNNDGERATRTWMMRRRCSQRQKRKVEAEGIACVGEWVAGSRMNASTAKESDRQPPPAIAESL
jgi:hypothetical protein